MNVTKVPCFGGYSRVLERANEIRSEVPDALFLNAGDEFQGTLFFRYGFFLRDSRRVADSP
jgi:5'-nucleotidase